MTIDALRHRRQVVSGGQAHLTKVAVALGANDPAHRMLTMTEVEGSRWDLHRRRPRRDVPPVCPIDDHGTISWVTSTTRIGALYPLSMTLRAYGFRRQ